MDVRPVESLNSKTPVIHFALWQRDADFVNAFHEWRITDKWHRAVDKNYGIRAEFTWAGSIAHGIVVYLRDLRIHTLYLEIQLEVQGVANEPLDRLQYEKQYQQALSTWLGVEASRKERCCPRTEEMTALNVFFDTMLPYIERLESKYIEMGFKSMFAGKSSSSQDPSNPIIPSAVATNAHRKANRSMLAVVRDMIKGLSSAHSSGPWDAYSLRRGHDLLRSVVASMTAIKLQTQKPEGAVWDILRVLLVLEAWFPSWHRTDAEKKEWLGEINDVLWTLDELCAEPEQERHNGM